MIVEVVDKLGKVVGETELDDSVWGIEPNIQVMHQALLRQLANARLGTRDTKTRGEAHDDRPDARTLVAEYRPRPE